MYRTVIERLNRPVIGTHCLVRRLARKNRSLQKKKKEVSTETTDYYFIKFKTKTSKVVCYWRVKWCVIITTINNTKEHDVGEGREKGVQERGGERGEVREEREGEREER